MSPPSDDAPVLHDAPVMTPTIFPSWDTFTAAFEAYQSPTFQLYVSLSSTSVAYRNQQMTKKCDTKYLNSGKHPLIPAGVQFYAKTMICTHGGKPRSRGQGIRSGQKSRAIRCPARLNALVKKKSGGDGSKMADWQVVVTRHTATHNHPLDAESFMSYPRNRRVQDPMVLEAVDALRKAGVKQGKIRKYIAEKEPTKHVTRSDVNNLLKKLKNDGIVVNAQNTPQELATVAFTPTVSAEAEREAEVADEGGSEPVGVEIERERVATGESDSGSTGEVAASSASAGMHEATAGNTELRAEERSSIDTPIYAGFTIRRGSGRQRLPTAVQGGHQRLSAVARGSRNGEADATALSELRDSDEIASGSFKLQVHRLEEQNMALHTQDTKLVEQNRQYIADLTEAQKKTSDVQKELAALKKSEDTLKETVDALSCEVARLKAESARWKRQAQQPSPGATESQVAIVSSNRCVDECNGSSRDPAQVPKRALDSGDFGGEAVFLRPHKQKRASNCESS